MHDDFYDKIIGMIVDIQASDQFNSVIYMKHTFNYKQ